MSLRGSIVLHGGVLSTGTHPTSAPDASHPDGWVVVVDGTVAALGHGHVPDTWDHVPHEDVAGRRIVPGLVDIHCHGAGGATFGARPEPSSTQADDALRALAHHRSHGTTTTVASLVTAPIDTLADAVAALAELVEQGDLAGVHLEGPWLSPLHRGAHDPALLRDPALPEVDRLLTAAGGVVRVVTIAPELTGGLEAVRRIVGHGAVAAIGHTDADASTALAAVDAGSRLATHLFNAMPPVHHRRPGAVLALLEDERAVVELIADGVHLHPLTLAHAARSAGAGRTALVTDAMAATGMADGPYLLGGLAVDVLDGVARLREGGAIAGSTLTLDAALRYATLVAGVPFDDALAAATSVPAGVIGRDDIGRLAVGARGDVVVLDDTLTVSAVYRGGTLV
ncbi:N-acetylglucosamine-6-phosphate deacetylase [Sanguibacter antarcticus]|uniref:N-acetylglucosamine 6-phosphate deacetylase n=1 Tax=Sanguibacter antarcticus TaxID=372484 RepID=A0A2A9E7F8_9MICO|nr:N-acetylglucosamine-6-phosphate deacetylase [Sanguibacter antarcticus]PFG34794.1 N-acetylglucosamine 6-phosphate deacetylase [Sanguibacter antarcticus]